MNIPPSIRVLNPAITQDVDVLKKAYVRVLSPAFNHKDIIPLRTLLEYFTDGSGKKGATLNAVIAENVEKTPVGLYLFLTFEDKPMAYVLYNGVSPSMRGKDVGTRLASRAKERAREIYHNCDVPYVSDIVDTENPFYLHQILHKLQRKTLDVNCSLIDRSTGRTWRMVVAPPARAIAKEYLLYALTSYENMLHGRPIGDDFGNTHPNVIKLQRVLDAIEGNTVPLNDIPPLPALPRGGQCSDRL